MMSTSLASSGFLKKDHPRESKSNSKQFNEISLKARSHSLNIKWFHRSSYSLNQNKKNQIIFNETWLSEFSGKEPTCPLQCSPPTPGSTLPSTPMLSTSAGWFFSSMILVFVSYQALSEITLLWFLSKDQIFEKIFVAKYSQVGAPSQVPHLGFPHLPLWHRIWTWGLALETGSTEVLS